MPYKDKNKNKRRESNYKSNLKYWELKKEQGYVRKGYIIPAKYVDYIQRIVKYLNNKFELERSKQ